MTRKRRLTRTRQQRRSVFLRTRQTFAQALAVFDATSKHGYDENGVWHRDKRAWAIFCKAVLLKHDRGRKH